LERQYFKTLKNDLVLAEINEDRSIPNIVLQLLGLAKVLMPLFPRSGKSVLPVSWNESLKYLDVNPFTHI
jgi:hypothetical protein